MATLQHLSARVNAADPLPERPGRKAKPAFAPVTIGDAADQSPVRPKARKALPLNSLQVADRLRGFMQRLDIEGEWAILVVHSGTPVWSCYSVPDPTPDSDKPNKPR